MISKIHKNLLSQVKTQSTNNYSAVVSSFNYVKTAEELKKLNIKYKGYPFASCFSVNVDYPTLISISKLPSVQFLSGTTEVLSCIHKTKEFLNIDKLTENKYFGKDITVAFIDTGISPHLDFIFPYNRILEFVDLVNHKTLPYDDNGHGSFVASVCLGSGKRLNNQYAGIAPLSKIVMIKALNHKGETNSDRILDAMQYIFDNKERLNIKIVCMSFGSDNLGDNDPLQKGANSLWNKGIAVVAAAGNSGPNEKTIKSPGTSSRIITVGGLDSSDIENLKVADFSSRGPVSNRFKPDLIAPSVDIIGANISPTLPYIKMSGTSVATPITAGICAIILEKNPKINVDRLKYFLTTHCYPLLKNKNSEGFGYLNFK